KGADPEWRYPLLHRLPKRNIKSYDCNARCCLNAAPHRREKAAAFRTWSGSDLGHCSNVSVGSGDHHCVDRSVQLSSLHTFYLGDSPEGRKQDRPPAESIRAAPTGRLDSAAERLSQAR